MQVLDGYFWDAEISQWPPVSEVRENMESSSTAILGNEINSVIYFFFPITSGHGDKGSTVWWTVGSVMEKLPTPLRGLFPGFRGERQLMDLENAEKYKNNKTFMKTW